MLANADRLGTAQTPCQVTMAFRAASTGPATPSSPRTQSIPPSAAVLPAPPPSARLAQTATALSQPLTARRQAPATVAHRPTPLRTLHRPPQMGGASHYLQRLASHQPPAFRRSQLPQQPGPLQQLWPPHEVMEGQALHAAAPAVHLVIHQTGQLLSPALPITRFTPA